MSAITSRHTLVLVSGANQGLGYEIVKKLAAEQADYHILLGSRNFEKGKKAAGSITNVANGTSVEPIELDIDSDDSLAKAATYVAEKYGRLDVLFNNAGISKVQGVTPREEFNRVLTTNVTGYACTTEAFLPLLRKAEMPRLLFMSSGLGSLTCALDPQFPFYGLGVALRNKAYITSKCADNMLGVLYAVQLGKEGFKVNMIDPGFRATNLNGYAEAGGDASEGAIQACKLIADTDKNGLHATFTSMDRVYPW
jgi:NAD(P)-dependent dehydrogenase (short-subunit alcohol dehydrogenase family)